MEENTQSHHPVLELAWKRFAELDANSGSLQDSYMRQRRTIIILAVLATLLAILFDGYGDALTGSLVGEILRWTLQILLIATPITSSAIAAFSNKFQQGQKYLAMRGAAEEILKELYIYRTVMQSEDGRHKWLNGRLATIQRNMFKSISGELVLKTYKGNIPPYYNPKAGYGDPGFSDLSGQEYLEYRLEDQLAWHIKENLKLQTERKRIQIYILAFGGLGALLAALGHGLSIWVALTSSFVAAFFGWEELRGLDIRVTNYSRVVLELGILRDYWMALDEREKTSEEFYKFVRSTENILWTQHSEFLKAMQEEFAEHEGKEAALIENIIQKSRESADELQEKIFAEAEELVIETIDEVTDRVALGVEDSAAQVQDGMARISDEIEDYYEARAAAMAAEADDYVDEVLEQAVGDDITAAVDAALAESVAFEDEVFTDEDEDFVDEVFVDDDEDFEDEVFDDEDSEDEDFGEDEFADLEDGEFEDEIFDDDDDDIFDTVEDDDDWGDETVVG